MLRGNGKLNSAFNVLLCLVINGQCAMKLLLFLPLTSAITGLVQTDP